jgi:hypothetical protein
MLGDEAILASLLLAASLTAPSLALGSAENFAAAGLPARQDSRSSRKPAPSSGNSKRIRPPSAPR